MYDNERKTETKELLKMAVLTEDTNTMPIIKSDKVEEFLRIGNENKISLEELKKCDFIKSFFKWEETKK